MPRNVLLTGGSPGHRFEETAEAVAAALDLDGLATEIIWDPAELAGRLTDPAGMPDLVTVMALCWTMTDPRYADRKDAWAYSPDPETRAAITRFVTAGGGLLALHTATVCFDDWPGWAELLGGAWSWGQSFHQPVGMAAVAPTGRAHPITAGLTAFAVRDEIYEELALASELEPLLDAAGSDGRQPVLWARSCGAGRVVVDTLGHDVDSWQQPTHAVVLRRSARWALGGTDQEVLAIAPPNTDEPTVITITDGEQAVAALRNKHLRQALYDAGDVVMADVLVNLHGTEHRDRRRLENRLFRKDTHLHYERDLFPEIIEATIRPHVEAGRTELVELGHQLMMNLAAVTAGVDRPLGTPEESLHLYAYLMTFIEGATLAHYTGDVDAKRAEVAAALAAFDHEFLQPSIARRRDLIERLAAGEITEADLPRDVLTVILQNQEGLDLPADVVLRETCFFLLASAHTSATAFTRTLHNLFGWLAEHPEGAARARSDQRFVQRAVHETVRLSPSSPVAMRWALEDIDLPGDLHIPVGSKVVVDLLAVNQDPTVWGIDATRFDPDRVAPEGRSPWGLSFGSGMHACIGQDLAGGLLPVPGRAEEEDLYGLVPVVVQWMLDHGARPDPDDPPEIDPTTARQYWKRYPARFGA